MRYRRFSSRLGHASPAKQWNRCLEMIENEEWVWVIPDDDWVSPNSVEEFYGALDSDREGVVNVFTIPLEVVDEKDRVVREAHINAAFQDNYEFYLRQLKGESTGSSLGENIFRRKNLLDSGGFPEFPKAWGSDHAAILRASSGGKISCLSCARFRFRQSGLNISSRSDDGHVKMRARVIFAQWLKDNEGLFAQELGATFFQYVYWKGEYYAVHEWEFSWRLLLELIRLRRVCTGSLNPIPLLKLFANRKCSSIC